MKRLALPTLLALAATGCTHTLPAAAPSADAERAKCALVQTLMHEREPQRLLAGLMEKQGEPSQVVVYLRTPGEDMLERLFAGEPACASPEFKVVQESTREAVVLFLQARGRGYVYAAQRAAPGELSLGGEPKGSVSQNEGGGWVASDVL